ncbi:PREDICTED: origin recognition complex subunit 2-like [Branchiostoma belcheri]|uniref:Origin recognition complex subunit 2 n=1 Tax=Branchiostoma belcheri TaxID=7741 RepID=A0A6P4ZN07_BRABE|nr:PREDICTED: origin recognition complex subunit 2-like [Branchiostoma belcheri]
MAAPMSKGGVEVKFVGDEDVLQHVVDKRPTLRSNSRSARSASTQRTVGVLHLTNQEQDSSEEEDEQEESIQHPTALVDQKGVAGSEVYSFKTPKRTGQMTRLAEDSVKNQTPKPTSGKTPVRRSTRKPTKRTKASYRASSSDESESDDSGESESSAGEEPEPVKPRKPAVPPTVTRRRRGGGQEEVLPEMVEEYFHAHGGARPGPTSDRTLSKLQIPRMDQARLQSVLQYAPAAHIQHLQQLYQQHRTHFHKWMLQLSNGFNLLLYGLGSKRVLIDQFRTTVLRDTVQMVVNGYFPSITVKHILNSITEEVLEHTGSFRSVQDQLTFIKDTFEETGEELFLFIHNIDGPMLRGEKVQSVLCQLAQVGGVRIIATIDHINAPLIWDQNKASRFNWLWYDVTSYEPYVEETSYENSLMVQQSGVLALSSLVHVLRSLTPNARGIFHLLAEYQLEHKDDSSYIGMSFHDLYQRCREKFLVHSHLTLRAQLTEFKDHKLIRTKKGSDGVENLLIPLDGAMLAEYMENPMS